VTTEERARKALVKIDAAVKDIADRDPSAAVALRTALSYVGVGLDPIDKADALEEIAKSFKKS
jgi:hypothetical protein